jgi:hypothetical protein
VVEEPKLTTLVTLRVARGNMPAHLLMYKPGEKNETPDYAICWQCYLSMRMFNCPPEQRYLLGSSPVGEQAMEKILTARGGLAERYQVNAAKLQAIKADLLGGLITHLRSVSVGLRVSETLTNDYPELLDLEVQHVEKELKIGLAGLAPSIREMMPQEIYNATHIINAAYALFWAERLEKPGVVNAFRQEHLDGAGQQLLDIYENIPGDPMHDYELIDRWADYLKISGWYTWLPYQAP